MGIERVWVVAAMAAAPLVAAAQWKYTTEVDKMTSGKAEFAELWSKNSLRLSFPYQGPNKGRITVRRLPADGVNVLVALRNNLWNR